MIALDLKNSILQLAIQGKLVEQREEEGTARELVQKIMSEKKQLIKEGKIRKEKPFLKIEDEEKPFDVPSNWEWIRFGDLGSYRKGPFGSALTKAIFVPKSDEAIKIYEQKNAIQKSVDIGEYYITKEYFESKMKGFELSPGDIIVSCAGTIGETYVMPDNFKQGIINQALMQMKLMASVDVEYFLMYFDFILKKTAIKSSKGSAIKNIPPFDELKNYIVPLPPLEEQKRIVAKIEELKPYVDKYDVSFSEVKELNKKFPEEMQRSILQYAIQGKLVEQREEDGTAEDLYKQIQEEKKKLIKEGKIKKTKALQEITEDETPFDIPENWKWVRFEDIFEINPRNVIKDEINVSFIPMTLIEDGYRSEFTYETRSWGEVKKGYTHFQDGDIVMAKITPCFQNLKSALMEGLVNNIGAGTTELHVLRAHSVLNTKFYMWFIKSPVFVETCVKNMTGTAGQKRVPTDILKKFVVPLPPLEEQKRITKKIEELLPFAKKLVK